MTFPLRLALARFRVARGQALLVIAGVAAGAGLLAAVLAGSLAAQDRSLTRAVRRLPADERAVRAVWGGLPDQGTTPFAKLERTARRAFRPLSRRAPFAVAIFAETQVGTTTVDLGAIDGLARWVRLTSGRLPRTCSAERCEVVRVGGSGTPPPERGLRLVVVGTGRLRSQLPLDGLVSQTSRRPETPFVLAPAVAPLARNAALSYDSRTYTWVLPLDGGLVHPWNARRLVRAIVAAGSTLGSIDSSFEVSAPQDAILAADDDARVAGRRLLLLGGEAAALLLAFLVLAASRMRREARAASRRLTWLGATPVQVAAAATGQAALLALAGVVVGWAAGAGAGALLADRLGAPAGEVLRHSVVDARGVALALVAALVAAAVLLATLLARPLRLGRLSVSAVDVAALAAVATVALALARGVADQQSLATERGTGVVLLLLPGLIVFAGAVLAARIVVPALRLLERLGRRGPVAARLAALSLARNPGYAAVTVAFLVVSLGLALFAATYRSTLARGQRDQAAFAVPADVVLSEDLGRLVPVVEAAAPSVYRRLGEAAPVLRLAGDVPGSTSISGLTVLGLPAGALPRIDGWRGDFSPVSLAELARRLRPRAATGLRGARLPPGRALELPVTARGDDLALSAVLETPRGTFDTVRLGSAPRGRHVVLRGRVAREAVGGRLVAIAPELPNTGIHDNANGPGTRVSVVSRGTAVLGLPRVGRRALAVDYSTWLGTGGARVLAAGGRSARIAFVLTPDRDASLRPRVATDSHAVPVVASQSVAAEAGSGGALSLDVEDQPVRARIVATASRFPSIDGDFVVADRSELATAMNASAPGTGVTNEVWVDGRGVDSAARRPPFGVLAATSQRRVEAGLDAEPLARGSLLVLEAGALAALVLALAGVVLGVLTDLRDEREELLDLEAQGAGPALLRRQVRLRAALVWGVGLVGGLAVGAALSALVVRLVTLAANPAGADSSLPPLPLRLFVDWTTLGLALAGLVAAAALLVTLPTRRAFR